MEKQNKTEKNFCSYFLNILVYSYFGCLIFALSTGWYSLCPLPHSYLGPSNDFHNILPIPGLEMGKWFHHGYLLWSVDNDFLVYCVVKASEITAGLSRNIPWLFFDVYQYQGFWNSRTLSICQSCPIECFEFLSSRVIHSFVFREKKKTLLSSKFRTLRIQELFFYFFDVFLLPNLILST